MSITKAELVERVSESADVSKTDVSRVFDALAEAATKALKKDGEVVLPGFGKLKVAKTKARTGRNPKTGEPIKIAAGKRVRLSVAKSLKDAVA